MVFIHREYGHRKYWRWILIMRTYALKFAEITEDINLRVMPF